MKKILISSLGAQKVEWDNDNLSETVYKLGEQPPVRAAISPGALVQYIDFDYVIYAGTVKSHWDLLYRMYCKDPDRESFEQISRFRAESDRTSDFTAFDQKIAPILHTCSMDWEAVFLPLYYGLDSSEIMGNYVRLKDCLTKIINSDVSTAYEIVFDLTGSLRSLPVYQMLFVNYFKNLGNVTVDLKNMYYAMYEAKREFEENGKEVVKIVDLRDLLDLSSLIAGITEFNNTGSAITLCAAMDEQNAISPNENLQKLSQSLKEFDWAVGTNDLTRQKEICTRLVDMPIQGDAPVEDAMRLLIRSVKDNFAADIQDINSSRENGLFQFNVARWFEKQKRYGLAAATVMEALRSLLVVLELESQNQDVTEEEIQNEEARRNAVAYLDEKAKKYQQCGERTEWGDLFLRLSQAKKPVVDFRNRFAHNLASLSDTGESVSNASQEMTYEVEKIHDFMDIMEKFTEQFRSHARELAEEYKREINRPHSSKNVRKGIERSVYLCIFDEEEQEPDRYFRRIMCSYAHPSTSNKKYQIYLLPRELRIRLKETRKSQEQCQIQADWLCRYLEEHWDMCSGSVEIIFYRLGFRQMTVYADRLFKRAKEWGIHLRIYSEPMLSTVKLDERERNIAVKQYVPEFSLEAEEYVVKEPPAEYLRGKPERWESLIGWFKHLKPL